MTYHQSRVMNLPSTSKSREVQSANPSKSREVQNPSKSREVQIRVSHAKCKSELMPTDAH